MPGVLNESNPEVLDFLLEAYGGALHELPTSAWHVAGILPGKLVKDSWVGTVDVTDVFNHMPVKNVRAFSELWKLPVRGFVFTAGHSIWWLASADAVADHEIVLWHGVVNVTWPDGKKEQVIYGICVAAEFLIKGAKDIVTNPELDQLVLYDNHMNPLGTYGKWCQKHVGLEKSDDVIESVVNEVTEEPLPLCIKELRDDLTVEILKEKFPWVLAAKIQNAIYFKINI